MKTVLSMLLVALGLAGCAGQVKPLPAAPEFFQTTGEAVGSLARNLGTQLGRSNLFIKTVPVDQFFDESSGEVAISSADLQMQLATALTTRVAGTTFQPLSTQTIETAKWVVLGGYSTQTVKERSGAWIKLRAAVTDIATGKRLASAETYLAAAAFNAAPTKFYKDAPMYLIDRNLKDKLAALSGVGIEKPMASTLGAQTAYGAAVAAYEAGQYQQAGQQFQAVLATSPQHRGALSGLYQSFWQQGMKTPAETAFGDLVGASVDAGSISAKLLFGVGSTELRVGRES